MNKHFLISIFGGFIGGVVVILSQNIYNKLFNKSKPSDNSCNKSCNKLCNKINKYTQMETIENQNCQEYQNHQEQKNQIETDNTTTDTTDNTTTDILDNLDNLDNLNNLNNLDNSLSNVHWCNLLYNYFDKNLKQYQFDANILDYGYKNIFDIEILKYENTGFYTWHVDHFASVPRTMSCILLLNNDYEGGELCFYDQVNKKEITIDKKVGRMILWPSNFLFPHAVKPVTKGTRFSVVIWAS